MRSVCAALLCAVLWGVTPPVAAEKIDCQSMAEIGAGLDMIREGLTAGEDVDDETDQALAGVVAVLREVAEAEQNAKLDAALDRLESAWHNNDRRGYVKALEDVDTLFGAFYTADCD